MICLYCFVVKTLFCYTSGMDLGKEYKKTFKKKEKVLSPTEKRKKDKEEVILQNEKLDITGGDNTRKAIEEIRKELRTDEQVEQERQDDEMEYLTQKRKYSDEGYILSLASVMYFYMGEADWPLFWRYNVRVSGRMIVLEFIDEYKRKFAKAMKVSGEVRQDYICGRRLVEEAENTIDFIQKHPQGKRTKAGIYLK